MPGQRLLAALLVVSAIGITPAAERSMRIDCLPDRIESWQAAEPSPETRFGAGFLPGIVLGPPADSLPYQGSVAVASLGFGGRAVIAFDEIWIEDRPGPDFIVFENGFFSLPLPTGAGEDYLVFAEPAIVELSTDGVEWRSFPYDAQALQESGELGGSIGRDLHLRMVGLAGLTPTFGGNWTMPNDPSVFDATGQGGISGAGGDAFDLADVGLSAARFVRITDANTQTGFGGAAEGFDLDTIVVLHGRPVATAGLDRDGDGLSDLEEQALYGSNPTQSDSDGDGIDDGREAASCRDPLSADVEPWFSLEPHLWLIGRSCTEARWTFVGSSRTYDLVRADGDALQELGGSIALGPTTCLADEQLNVRWSCDGDIPLPGDLFVYMVRIDGAADWGRSAGFDPRGDSTECP